MTFDQETAADNNLTNEKQFFDNIAEPSSENIHRIDALCKTLNVHFNDLIDWELANHLDEYILRQSEIKKETT